MAVREFHITAETCSDFCAAVYGMASSKRPQALKTVEWEFVSMWAVCHESSDGNSEPVPVSPDKSSLSDADSYKPNKVSFEKCMSGR